MTAKGGAVCGGCLNGAANRLLRPAEAKAQEAVGSAERSPTVAFYEGAISNTSFLWGASSMDFSR